MVITAEYTRQPECCVRCGVTPAKLNRHGVDDQGFIDTPVHGKAVAIKVMRKRFKCVDCGKTFQEPIPDMDEKRHMTRRLLAYIRKRSLERTFTEVCQSFVLDNGAFTFWKGGKSVNTTAYYQWVADWRAHPGFEWALIPDVIEGSEAENDILLAQWPFKHIGVPVWHLHESLDRLSTLASNWGRIALGSSAEYAQVGTQKWWGRIAEVMSVMCVDGSPITKLHGLRMLNSKVFERLPLSSADNTNIARNIGIDSRWKGTYLPPTKAARGVILANRIEAYQSAPIWHPSASNNLTSDLFPSS